MIWFSQEQDGHSFMYKQKSFFVFQTRFKIHWHGRNIIYMEYVHIINILFMLGWKLPFSLNLSQDRLQHDFPKGLQCFVLFISKIPGYAVANSLVWSMYSEGLNDSGIGQWIMIDKEAFIL